MCFAPIADSIHRKISRIDSAASSKAQTSPLPNSKAESDQVLLSEANKPSHRKSKVTLFDAEMLLFSRV
jgi:hypothetical protein